MGSNTASRKIKLQSCDGEEFIVPEEVAMLSKVLRIAILDGDETFPFYDITGKTLQKVIEYCTEHVQAAREESKKSDEELKDWDREFVDVDQPMLYDLTNAARYLDIDGLLDLTAAKVADMINRMSVEKFW